MFVSLLCKILINLNEMEKLFATYEPSKLMKEIGFDEPCFKIYLDGELTSFRISRGKRTELAEFEETTNTNVNEEFEQYSFPDDNEFEPCTAPLYDQIFDWFRKKHNLNGYVEFCSWNGIDEAWWAYTINIMDKEDDNIFSEKYFNHQECLDDLILKLIKQLNKNEKNIIYNNK